jgi:hypothetical protein
MSKTTAVINGILPESWERRIVAIVAPNGQTQALPEAGMYRTLRQSVLGLCWARV